MYWNAQGLAGKVNELAVYLKEENIDVACISETHFTDKSRTLEISGYYSFRADRATHMGGAVNIRQEPPEMQGNQPRNLQYIRIYSNYDVASWERTQQNVYYQHISPRGCPEQHYSK